MRHFLRGAAPALIAIILIVCTLVCGFMFRRVTLFPGTQAEISAAGASLALAVLIAIIAWPYVFGRPSSSISANGPDGRTQKSKRS